MADDTTPGLHPVASELANTCSWKDDRECLTEVQQGTGRDGWGSAEAYCLGAGDGRNKKEEPLVPAAL